MFGAWISGLGEQRGPNRIPLLYRFLPVSLKFFHGKGFRDLNTCKGLTLVGLKLTTSQKHAASMSALLPGRHSASTFAARPFLNFRAGTLGFVLQGLAFHRFGFG